jgi:hypothetical protein
MIPLIGEIKFDDIIIIIHVILEYTCQLLHNGIYHSQNNYNNKQ